MLLTDSLKQTIYEIDAFLGGYTLGTLIIEDGQALLELSNGKYLHMNDSFQIEVITDSGKYLISYQQAISTISTDGWYLYAGFQAMVKQVIS